MKLRLNKRLALYVQQSDPADVIVAGSTAGFVSLDNPLTFQLNTNQWFKLIAPFGRVSATAGNSLLSFGNVVLVVTAVPALGGVTVPLYKFGVESAPRNPVGFAGVAAHAFETPLFAHDDYLQQTRTSFQTVQYDVFAEAGNADAVDHPFIIEAGCVVEIYDNWEGHGVG